MANVQLENGYIRIANDIFDQLISREFTLKQHKIINLILRFSYGFNKKHAFIDKKTFFELCGIYKGDIASDLKYLCINKVIFVEGNFYKINKNYDEWKIPYHKLFDEEKYSDLKRKQLVNHLPNKDESKQNTNQTVSNLLTKQLVNYLPIEAENIDGESNNDLSKDNKDNKDINKERDIYIKDEFLNFLSEKNVNLDFGLVDIKKTEYDVLLSRILNAGVVKTEQEAETLLIEIIKEYDIWRAKGKGSENQFADLITFTKNRIRDIKNDFSKGSKIKPLQLKQEQEPDPYDLFFASLKRGGYNDLYFRNNTV